MVYRTGRAGWFGALSGRFWGAGWAEGADGANESGDREARTRGRVARGCCRSTAATLSGPRGSWHRPGRRPGRSRV